MNIETASFDGDSYDENYDGPRLESQLLLVFEHMRDSKWATLKEIIAVIKCGTTASISARLRDFRKPKFGGHSVERRRLEGEEHKGIWEYQLTINSAGITHDNKPTAVQMGNLGHTKYEEYLESTHWTTFRDDYFSRHPKKCAITSSEDDIHLHHVAYVNIGKETDEDVVPLCREMHELVHQLNENRQIPLKECHVAVEEVINAVLSMKSP